VVAMKRVKTVTLVS